MASHNKSSDAGSLRGTVYGDIIGAPFIIENTSNRYFDIGEPQTVITRGRSRKCFAECTEVSHGAAAVSRWIRSYRDDPTAESLQKELRDTYNHHPGAQWTESTRLFLSSNDSEPSELPQWAAITRVLPIAMYCRDDLFKAIELTEAAVKATCVNEETLQAARAITQCVYEAQTGLGTAPLRTMLEMQYGYNLSRPEDDLRSELRGAVRKPLVIMGKEVEGGYYYEYPAVRAEPSAGVVAEAAFRAVISSDSWEDAVRRAVSYGGPSNAVAAIAGGIAETVYGVVTPKLVGKLYNVLPPDIAHHFSELDRAVDVAVTRRPSPYAAMQRDAVTIVILGKEVHYAVPEDMNDIRMAIMAQDVNSKFISPEEVETLVGMFGEMRQGTFAYGIRPEITTLYLQNGQRLVPPSAYSAAGMPSLQERKKHLEEFNKLRSYCIEVQKRMNMAAGNNDAGQIHYGDAYHMYIGIRKVEFFMGDIRSGSISLDDRGLLKLDIGEYRDISVNARFENHREQAWKSRGVFSIQDSINPIGHLQDIRNEIAHVLLDEGKGLENNDLDNRHLNEEERMEAYDVSNLEHLEKIDPGESLGLDPVSNVSALIPCLSEKPVCKQPVNKIYMMGYGTRSLESFINTLHMKGIDTVVDVRSIPKSKWVPHFNEDNIFEALESEGIGYLSAGEKLGNRTSDKKLQQADGRTDWKAVSETSSYKEAINSLEKLANEGHLIAIVSSEWDPLTSHRFGMVSRTLSENGMDVLHILYNGECVSQTELEGRLLDKYTKQNKISCVANGSYSDQLKEAFTRMNEEFGYKTVFTNSRQHRNRFNR